MQINVLAFGKLADIAGSNKWTIENVTSTDALKIMLENEMPILRTMTYKIAVDKKIANENILLTNDCEVALLPAFSGG